MQFSIITIFPNIFDSYFNESIISRAQDENIININTINLRDFTNDKHKTVDDTPYGGGAGMLMKVEPIYKAITSQKSKVKSQKSKTILLSAKGKKWNQSTAREYSKLDNVTMICGRYEGVDERVNEFIDEEISIGDFVMTGGEIGAMTIVDSITRLLPGSLGNTDSAVSESHSIEGELEYPQYTRPEIFHAAGKDYEVPKILLSGHHENIEKWKKKNKEIRNKR
jgi:tRNA (guanine37-N1)-methyltransferase